jgi:molecular chaperone GrpE
MGDDAKRSVRASGGEAPHPRSGPGDGVRGNREVPPTPSAEPDVPRPSSKAEPKLPETDDLEQRLAAAETAAEQHLDDLKRLAAEFDNFRKRAAREQEALVSRAHERLVKELLPVVDDLERALDAAEQHEEAKLEEGVRLVHRALADVLRKEGLAEIETDGAFDPHVHEALLAQPGGDETESGHVLQVLQKGYRLGDRVLRPARVIVAE